MHSFNKCIRVRGFYQVCIFIRQNLEDLGLTGVKLQDLKSSFGHSSQFSKDVNEHVDW